MRTIGDDPLGYIQAATERQLQLIGVKQLIAKRTMQNAVEAALRRTPPADRSTPPPSTAAVEKRAANVLARKLKTNPNLSRAEARPFCRNRDGTEMGPEAFKRVWPEARVSAGLPRKARAGKKPRRP
jgi:hypothetical protein